MSWQFVARVAAHLHDLDRMALLKRKFILFVLLIWCLSVEGELHRSVDMPTYAVGGSSRVWLPKRMSPSFFKPKDLCKDAKRRGKAFALVGVPRGNSSKLERLKIARVLADPCNRFLMIHFARYHAYFGYVEKGTRDRLRVPPGMVEILQEWGDSGRRSGIVVLDVNQCRAISFLPWEEISNEEDSTKREELFTNSLLKRLNAIQEKNENLIELLSEPVPVCPENFRRLYPSASLSELSHALELQTENENPVMSAKEARRIFHPFGPRIGVPK